MATTLIADTDRYDPRIATVEHSPAARILMNDSNPSDSSIVNRIADELIHGDRQSQYGTYADEAERLRDRWQDTLRSITGVDDLTIPVDAVPLMMVDLKVVRLGNNPGHADSWIDIAGYAGCAGKLPWIQRDADKIGAALGVRDERQAAHDLDLCSWDAGVTVSPLQVDGDDSEGHECSLCSGPIDPAGDDATAIEGFHHWDCLRSARRANEPPETGEPSPRCGYHGCTKPGTMTRDNLDSFYCQRHFEFVKALNGWIKAFNKWSADWSKMWAPISKSMKYHAAGIDPDAEYVQHPGAPNGVMRADAVRAKEPEERTFVCGCRAMGNVITRVCLPHIDNGVRTADDVEVLRLPGVYRWQEDTDPLHGPWHS